MSLLRVFVVFLVSFGANVYAGGGGSSELSGGDVLGLILFILIVASLLCFLGYKKKEESDKN